MTKVLDFVPPPPSKVKRGLPVVFDRLVARALAKSPSERFPNAWLFREEVCAAYFALTRQQPHPTLPSVRGTPSPAATPPAARPSAPSGVRTTIVQSRPSSWSATAAASEQPSSQSAAAKSAEARAEKEPELPPVEVLAVAAELKPMAPPAAAMPTADLGDKTSPLEGNLLSYAAESPRPTRGEASAPAKAAAAQRAEAPAPERPSKPVEAPQIAAVAAVAAVAASAPVRPPAPVAAGPAPVQAPPPAVPAPPNPAPARSAMLNVKRPTPLTDASIAHGGRVLARFVGPIAIVLSKRAAQDAHDERGYFELLAAHLADPEERTKFYRALRQRPS